MSTSIRVSEQIYMYSELINKLLKLNFDDFRVNLPATAKNNLIQSCNLLKECCSLLDEILKV
ncbi:MAG TPA: hypothetical protein ENG16_00935 [Archaeoglobus sp.]|nr:hypothetical protein [Archaeoglobus sp.]